MIDLGNCEHTRCIPVEELDTAVLVQLFETFVDMKKIREAVNDAIPNADERKLLIVELEEVEKQRAMYERNFKS